MSFERQLGQLRPTSITPEVLFSPTENKPYKSIMISIANVTGSPVNVSIYHDEDGITHDETTALMFSFPIESRQVVHYEGKIRGYKSTGSIAVQSSISQAVTFTMYGEIIGEVL